MEKTMKFTLLREGCLRAINEAADRRRVEKDEKWTSELYCSLVCRFNELQSVTVNPVTGNPKGKRICTCPV